MWELICENWVTVASVALNAVGIPVGGLLAAKYGLKMKSALRAAELALDGLGFLERAVDQNKADVKNGVLRKVTEAIEQYGPAATATVEEARRLLHRVETERKKDIRKREDAIIAAEHEERAEMEARRRAAMGG